MPVAEERGLTHRSLVRWLFFGVASFLIVQFAYAYAVEEPYPGFVFPSFQGVPDDNGPVRLLRPRLVVRSASQAIDVPYEELLAPAPRFAADAIAFTVFSPQPSGARPRSTPTRFRRFLKQPTVARGKQDPTAALRDPRTRTWLRRRLARLFPSLRPQTLDVLWEQHRYLVRGHRITETVTPVARLRVQLEG